MAEASANAIDRDVHEIKAIGETVWQPELVPRERRAVQERALFGCVFLQSVPRMVDSPIPQSTGAD